jgi:hypothetical protein
LGLAACEVVKTGGLRLFWPGGGVAKGGVEP